MKILVLPGDGIGPEIVAAGMHVLETVNAARGLDLKFEYDDVGLASLEKHGTTLRPELFDRISDFDGVVLGPQDNLAYPPPEEGGVNISARFRIGLDLFANARPARTRPGLAKGKEGLDLVVMRELTEGFYADRTMFVGTGEFMPTPDLAMSVRKVTAQGCERIARAAFELAMKRRKKVTAVHKANVLKVTDGLYLEQVRKVAKEFPDVELDDVLIDAMTAYLVRDPSRFDVVLATNMYGDILSDLASELSGSLGLAGSTMASATQCFAQAQHGSAPDIEGQDKANPTSLILSIVMLLDWLSEKHGRDDLHAAAKAMNGAVDAALAEASTRTVDLGGQLGTKAFGDHVARSVS
ncbi:MAG: isocitrate/isopropylmalate dehydrogenase family protein [Hyphomicrobiaceae bacterium]|nr:isocitrate/isopropylmalate dehydrogenase family protein [Hyphomicrobiaceae bacterium]